MVIRVTPSGSISCEISDFRIVVDPGPRERAATGPLRLASSEASEPRPRRGDLILKTLTELPLIAAPPETINHPGEYEISGVKVKGIEMVDESDVPPPGARLAMSGKTIKTSYLVEADGIRLCFLDGVVKEPDDVFLEKLGEVDVLFMSADKKSIDSKKLAGLVKGVEPHIVVPTNEAAAESLSEGLGKKPEVVDRLVIKRKDLESEEGTKFIWIKEK